MKYIILGVWGIQAVAGLTLLVGWARRARGKGGSAGHRARHHHARVPGLMDRVRFHGRNPVGLAGMGRTRARRSAR